jgi:hypothetical protein
MAGTVIVQGFGGMIIAVLSGILQLLTNGVRSPNRRDALRLSKIRHGSKSFNICVRGRQFVRLGFRDYFGHSRAGGSIRRLKRLLELLGQLGTRKRVIDTGAAMEAASEGKK